MWPFDVRRKEKEKKRKRLIIIGSTIGVGVVGIGVAVGLVLGLKPKGTNVTISVDRVRGGNNADVIVDKDISEITWEPDFDSGYFYLDRPDGWDSMDYTAHACLLVRINGLEPNALVSTFSNIELDWDQSFVQMPSDPTITAKPYPQDGSLNQFVGDTYLKSAGEWEWSSEVSGPITGQLDIKFIPNTKKPNKVVDKKIDLTINLS